MVRAVREIVNDRTERISMSSWLSDTCANPSVIEQHYWKLWGLDSDESAGQGMSALQADSEFQGEEITIDAKDIEQFCKGELIAVRLIVSHIFL